MVELRLWVLIRQSDMELLHFIKQNLFEQDSKVSKGCAVLIELETLRNTKELSVFNVFSF